MTVVKPSANMLSAGVLSFVFKGNDLVYMDRFKNETRQKIIRLRPLERERLLPLVVADTEASRGKFRSAVIALIKYVRAFEPERII